MLKLANNASSTLAGAITAGATTITVQPGHGARFPALGAGDWFPVTLVKLVGGAPVFEIARATGRSVDSMTITRAQEGTTALTFSAGDIVELRPTAAVFSEYVPQGGAANYPTLTSTDFTTTNATATTLNADKVRAKNYIDKTVTNATATGTVTLDCALADVFDLTLSGNTTLALSNLPPLSGETFTIVVRVSQGVTAYSLTWFSGISWLTMGGTAPAAPTSSKTVEYVLTTKDGTTWQGRKGASN